MVSVVELVDTPDCGSGAAALRVQVPSLTPKTFSNKKHFNSFCIGGSSNEEVWSVSGQGYGCLWRISESYWRPYYLIKWRLSAHIQGSRIVAIAPVSKTDVGRPSWVRVLPPLPMKNVSIYSKGYWLIDSNVPRKLEDTPDARIRKSCETMSSHRD